MEKTDSITFVNNTWINGTLVYPATFQTEVEIKIYLYDPKEEFELPRITAEETLNVVYSHHIQEERTFCLRHIDLKEIKQKIKEIAFELAGYNQKISAQLLGLSQRALFNWVHRPLQS